MKVVATKLEQTYSLTSGLIRPLLVKEEIGTRPVERDEFPNDNTIFITFNYKEIESKYSIQDLFYVSYSDNDEFDPYDPKKAKFIARDKDIVSVANNEYFHVLNANFDPAMKIINDLAFEPKRFVVLRGIDKQLYGPFDYTVKKQPDKGTFDIELKSLRGIKNLPEYSTFCFTEDDFEVVELKDRNGDVRDKVLAASTSDLEKANLDYVDFISDDELIKWGNSLLSEASANMLSKAGLRKFRQEISSLEKDEPSFEIRKRRLLKLIDKTQFWKDQRAPLINDFLKETDEGKEQINSYIEANRDRYFELAEKKYEAELKKKYNDAEKRFADWEAKVEEKRSELNDLRQEIEKSQEKKREANLAASTEELESLNVEIESKNTELQALVENLNVANSIEALRIEKGVLERNIKDLESIKEKLTKEKSDLEQAGEQLRRHIQDKNEKLREKLSDFKPFIDMLNGVIPSREVPVDISLTPRRREDKPVTTNELIQEIQSKLSEAGRKVEKYELVNYIVSIQQSFFTIFSGLPGVGKTSLVTYLARVLGLEHANRFLTIATARGWTSPRDLIGFYNPLSGNFQPSSTGLFELLSAVQTDEAKAFPSWILLDEANLSPLEHYFSTFLRMCDDYVDRDLLTGDKGERAKLSVPRSMRFLGTVNYDATTEPLSPRMLDRVPVIQISPPQTQSFQFDEDIELSNRESLLTEEDMCELLSSDGSDQELEANELDLFDEVIKALHEPDSKKGLQIVVSPRKQQAIRKFCGVARPLMAEHYELSALDYAIAQHVLPLINGYGDTYRKRLEDLEKAIDQLDHSKRVLARILEAGENEHGFYRFFV